jgi:2-polyprenyl-6-methoxyphenol hydroxylase-like FAD-dependent oxidoreductase
MKPVLIVGAGPSGLMMAHELMRLGIKPKLIEKDLARSPYSRAIGVQIRTLEIFSALGLYKKLASKAQTVGGVEIYAEGRKPVKIAIENPSVFVRPHIVDEPHTEQVLEDALLSLGIKIKRGVELLSLRQEGDSVKALLKDENGTLEEEFSYVIGADGAHSTVRKSMENQFLGSAYEDAFILADATCKTEIPADAFRVFFKKKLFLAMIPMFGQDHYRLISVRRNDLHKDGPKPSIEEFKELIKQLLPFSFEIEEHSWVSRFFVQCRSARFYQDRRLFLIGDSAHIHSPAGGQGMNTGLQDAFNLAWKLSMVIKGQGKEKLLESYQQERKPVGDFLIERADRLFKFMVKSSLWARLLRRFVLPRMARSQDLRKKFFAILSQTAIRYQKGAICEKEHGILGNLEIGKRIPNLSIITNQLKKTDIHTLGLSTKPFFLLVLPASVDKKSIKLSLQLKNQLEHEHFQCHMLFANDYDAEALLGQSDYLVAEKLSSWEITEPSFIIVRPDHHIFCFGPMTDTTHGKESLNQVFYE